MAPQPGPREDRDRARISLWLKIPYTLFVAVLVPVYTAEYGAQNFLWYSDVALLVMTAALWLESRLLASMMSVGFLLPELVWVADFLATIALRRPVLSVAGYMVDPSIPLHLRGLSLFHLMLPPVMLWCLYRLGYDRRALCFQTPVTWGLLLATFLFTDPEANINWAFGLGAEPQHRIPPPLYLALMMIAAPLLLHLPTHVALSRLFAPKTR